MKTCILTIFTLMISLLGIVFMTVILILLKVLHFSNNCKQNIFWYQGYHSVLGELCRICILQTYHCGLCLPSVVNFLWWICAKVWTSINFVIFNCSHYFIWTNTVIHPFLDNIGEWNPSIQPFKWNLASFDWQTFLILLFRINWKW